MKLTSVLKLAMLENTLTFFLREICPSLMATSQSV